MGKRDFEKRETKQPKKGLKKAPTTIAEFIPAPVVEVVRKKRKEEEEEEE